MTPPIQPAPQNAQDWVVQTEARLRALETSTTKRVGSWVLSEQGGALVATSPGSALQDVGQDPPDPNVVDLTRGVFVTEDQVADAIAGSTTKAGSFNINFAQWGANIIGTASTVITNAVDAALAWGGGGSGSGSDAAQAQSDAQAILAQNAAAIAALQTQNNNSANSGKSAVIDFSALPNASSLPSMLTQTYSGTASVGTWGIVSGRACWIPGSSLVLGTARDCVAVYNVTPTDTDYQKAGVAFSSAPTTDHSGVGHSIITARSNLAGTSYVYVDMTRSSWEIGCVVAGTKTVWKTNTTAGLSFSFKASSAYWILPGTAGGPRIYQFMENSTVLYTYTEVGTTSKLGDVSTGEAESYRYPGLGARAAVVNGGAGVPANMLAFAFSDNTPAAVLGSAARFYRASATGVSHASGDVKVANGFFDTIDYATADITWTPGTNNQVTVATEGVYAVTIRCATANTSTGKLCLLWRNGVVAKRGGLTTNSDFAETFFIYLYAGDTIQPGVNMGGTVSSTGDATGTQSYFEIAKVA